MIYNLKNLLHALIEKRKTRKPIKICDLKNRKTLQNCLIVRCDIERNPIHALSFAEILKNNDIFGSFYFHTRTNSYDVNVMKKIQEIGHEVGLHHECLDRCNGDFKAARELFLKEVEHFRKDEISIKTVCAHGEAGITKKGYKHCYDLFVKYPNLLDEAGLLGEAYLLRKPFELTYAGDIFASYRNFFQNIYYANEKAGLHILIHPHRWHYNFLKSSWQIFLDLKQREKNKLFKKRSYQTVLN